MPARKDYLPTRIADLIEWMNAFFANIAAFGQSVGLSEQAVTDFGTTLTRAREAVALASDPATRTRPIVERQQDDLDTLRRSTRGLVRQIQAHPQTTDEQRRTLGITVPDRNSTPKPAPSEEPVVVVTRAVRRTVAIKMRREDGRRGKAPGCIGMNVYYAVGEIVPTTIGGWTHVGQCTRTDYAITLPDDVPAGATVWVTANYYNGKGETGPLADAISTNLPGGQARVGA